MRESSQTYGRQYELSWLSSRLFPARNPHGVSPLVLLHGPTGCGKSYLASALVKKHKEEAGKAPLIVFSADASLASSGVTEFTDALMRTGDTTVAELKSEISALKGFFKVRINEWKKERTAVSDAYNLDGSVRTLVLPESMIAGDSGLQELAALTVSSLVELYERASQLDMGPVSPLRVLYVFDDFSDFAPPVKRWLGGSFLEEFSKQSQLPAPSFLLTDQDSWEVGGQMDYWQKNPGTFFNQEIAALDRESCLQWLMDAGHPQTLIDILMEETEGMPGRIRQLLESPGLMQKKAQAPDESKDLPFQASAQERRWLHASAMGDFVSEESLQILLGQGEGKEAFEWLTTSCPLDGVSVVEMGGVIRIHIKSDLREVIILQCKSKVPARHREFVEKVELLSQVTGKVPSPGDRNSLRILAPVQPFNAQILKELFGRDD